MPGLSHYLLLATLLFGIGIYGVLSRRNVIAVLMSVELMLNAVNINFIAVVKFVNTGKLVGQVFALFVIVVAAAEIAVGLALIIAMYRHKKSVNLNDFNLLKW
ncbi:MAG: NADH-quinone oxidoreductase subunit NuoK [Syntrophomonas sp.]